MPRFVVATRREVNADDQVQSAHEIVSSEPGVTVLSSSDPHVVTIETSQETADKLRDKLVKTHFVEPEVKRGLE